MNKIYIGIACLFLLSIGELHAWIEEQPMTLEIRSGAFIHANKRFKKLYGKIGTSYQIEASLSLPPFEYLRGWSNFDYFSKHSRAHRDRCCGKSKVEIPQISFGIKYIYPFGEFLDGYVGIGPSFSRINLTNKSCCLHEKVSKFAVGGILKSGIYYSMSERLFMDVFIDYLYQPVHFKKYRNVGGFKAGAGFGYKF
jgi:outer membrane protein